MKKAQRRQGSLPFAAALKSFIGHLEGSGKAKHTIDSYAFDLQSFSEFMQRTKAHSQLLDLRLVSRKDLERFHESLKTDGQKTNTRRRKLMTVRKLMNYLTVRKKLELDVAKRLPAPEKIERVPETVPLEKYREKLSELPSESYVSIRTLSILSLLADTGCSVSEAAKLRWHQLRDGKIFFMGKAERDCSLSPKTIHAFEKLKLEAMAVLKESHKSEMEDDVCFIGFNRHGPLRVGKKSLGITPRGIELLVKSVSENIGFSGVTPRTLRHSAVVEWFKSGVSEAEIQKRLGLKTPYAFRIYQPIFASIKSSSETTST